MDLLATCLTGDANSKAKSTKTTKRLSKNDSKESKKVLSKVNSSSIQNPLKKQKNEKILTEISSKKKNLIKESLKQQKNKENSLTKLVKNITKTKKSLVEDLTKSVEQPLMSKKNSKKVLMKSDAISKDKKNLLTLPKIANNNKSNTKLSDKKKKNQEKPKPKNLKKNSVEENALPKKINKTEKAEKLKGSETCNIKSKKRKISVETAGIPKQKGKTEPTKSIKVEANKKIKNIKSKKRKQLDIKNEENVDNKGSYGIARKDVVNYVEALIKVVENHEKNKKSLFDAERPPIHLLINCIKVPKVPLHQKRISLPHSVISSNDDVALFVRDLKKGRRRDYEDTVNYYQDLLKQHGCNQIKTVIPINQVKTEYRQFEMRRRLFGSYDYFLVDGRISGHITHLLGKLFRQKRKLPTSIHMDKDLKFEIDNALKKTCLQIHAKGDSYVTQVGSCSMKVEKIVDNIMAVIDELRQSFPGGWENIRSLRIKTPLSLAIPIYITLKNKNEVEVPVQAPKRPKAYTTVEGELSTFTSNVNVTVAPDGTVYVQNLGKSESDEDSENSDNDDILKEESKTKKIKKESKIEGVNKKNKVKSANDDEDDESNDS